MTNPILEAFYSLGSRINKRKGDENAEEVQEGIVGERLPELKLSMPNEDLVTLTQKWEKTWKESEVYNTWQQHGKENEDYWRGKQFNLPKVDKTRPLVDNVLFQSLETYLPQVTQHNPEPVVTLASGVQPTPENLQYATSLKNELYDLADEIKLRLKLKGTARHWSIYEIGMVKVTWDLGRDIPTAKVIRPWRMILDPESTVDEDGYTGEYLGEHRKLAADVMIRILDSIGGEDGYSKIITELVDNKMGTELGFIEWWTAEYMCWTIKDKVLLKMKNPHWNYPQSQATPESESPYMDQQAEPDMSESNQEAPQGSSSMPDEEMETAQHDDDSAITDAGPDEQGESDNVTDQPEEEEDQGEKIPGFNHLAKPGIPYLPLSVFNLGKQPVDDTSLMQQNLPLQDLINKRVRQIDKNADSMNGGMVVSLERAGMTMPQAKGVTEAVRKGGTVVIPAGAVNEAIARMSAPALPRDIYAQLEDTRSRVQYIFGTKGFTPTAGGGQAAVRSQLLNKNLDEGRISGGFSEYLEQLADDIYNWFIQMLYVYDERYAGQEHPKVRLTIKEGSILPRDSAAIAAQAVQLASAGQMSLLDLYKRLEFPNPEETAANAWLQVNAPELLYMNDPRVKQAVQMKMEAAANAAKADDKGPSKSINYKDLPPDGQAQLAEQAGINLHPEALAAYDDVVEQRSKPTEPEPVNQLQNGYVQPQ